MRFFRLLPIFIIFTLFFPFVQLWAKRPLQIQQLSGKVVDSNEKPLAGVEICLEELGRELKKPLRQTSAEDGTYRFVSLSGFRFIIKTKHPGFLATQRYITGRSRDLKQNLVLHESSEVRGRIETSGDEKCSFFLEYTSASRGVPFIRKELSVNGPGTFSFKDLPRGKGRVSIYSSDTSVKEAQLELSAPCRGLIVLLAPRARVVLKVLDENKEPVANVAVLAKAQNSRLELKDKRKLVRTDKNGRLSFKLPVGKRYSLYVGNDDYGPTVQKLTVFAGVNEKTVYVKKRFYLEGRLLSAKDGKPMAGYVVKCFPANYFENYWSSQWQKNPQAFTVGPEGNFFFEKVINTRGKTKFRVFPPKNKQTSLLTKEVYLQSNRGISLVDLKINPPGKLRGICRLQGLRGRAAFLKLFDEKSHARYSTFLRKDGKFAFPAVNPENYRLRLEVQGQRFRVKKAYEKKITIKSGEELYVTISEKDSENKEAGIGIAKLSGHITYPNGNAVKKQKVTLSFIKGMAGRQKTHRSYASHHRYTDEQGKYEFSSLAEGTWRIKVQRPGFVRIHAKVKVKSGSKNRYDYKLSKGHRISGEVFGVSGESKGNFELSLYGPLGQPSDRRQHQLDDGNRFNFAYLQKGQYTLKLRDKLLGINEARIESVNAGTEGIIIKLAKREKLGFNITDQSGSPLSHVSLFIRKAKVSYFANRYDKGFFSDNKGKYEFQVKPKTKYEVLLHKRDYCPQFLACEPKDKDYEVILEKAITVHGVAYDDLGAPLTGFEIHAHGEKPEAFTELHYLRRSEYKELLTEQGTFTLHNLPPGKLTFKLMAKGKTAVVGQCEKSVTKDSSPDAPIKVVFARPGKVSGFLESSQGVGMRHCRVTLVKPGDKRTRLTTTTYDEGAFSFPAVAEGNYSIAWRKKSGHNPLDSIGTKMVTVKRGEHSFVNLSQNSWKDLTYKFFGFIIPLAIELALAFLFIVLLIVNRGTIRQYWRLGLGLCFFIFCLELPSRILTFYSMWQGGIPQAFKANQGAFFVGLSLGLLLSFLLVFWYCAMWIVASAEWEKYKAGIFPSSRKVALQQGKELFFSFIFGVLMALITVAFFELFSVEEGDSVKLLVALFPTVHTSNWLRAIICMCAFTGVAIKEEIMFRGALQGFLLRLCKDNEWLERFSIAIVSMLWALLHLANASSPLLKVIQIFFFGLFIGELARRKSFECAVMAHVGLNVTSVLIALLY